MIRIIIADDHAILRAGLKRILSDCPDMELAGEAEDGDEALSLVEKLEADVLLLDIAMPGPGFLEVLRRVRVMRPALRVLVLSIHPEEHYAKRAIRAGAAGYLTKDRSPEELANAVRRVWRGGHYISDTLADRLAAELRMDGDTPLHETLSEREYQVMCMLGAGRSMADIATTLGLSPKTVGTYRLRIMRKMRFHAIGELIRYVIEHDMAR